MLCTDWEVSNLFVANAKHCFRLNGLVLTIKVPPQWWWITMFAHKHCHFMYQLYYYTLFLEKPHVSLFMIYPIKIPLESNIPTDIATTKMVGWWPCFGTFLQGTSGLGTALGPRRSRDFGGPRQGQDGAGALGGTGGWQGQVPWRHPLGGWGRA